MTAEQEILEQICGGGHGAQIAFKKLYDEVGGDFKRRLKVRGLNEQDAEDVLQQTMIKILLSARTYLGIGSARGWMWSIAKNTMRDKLREHKRRASREISLSILEPDEERLGQATPELEASSLLQKCYAEAMDKFMEEHPDRYETILLKMEGIGDQEIAERLGRTYAATRQYISQCRKILKPYLANCLELL